MMASSAGDVECDDTDDGPSTPQILAPVPESPTSSTLTAKAAEQGTANGIPESLSFSTGTTLPLQRAYVGSSEEPAHDAQAQLPSDIAGVPAGATNREPSNSDVPKARPVPSSVAQVSPSPEILKTGTHLMPEQSSTEGDASILKPASEMNPPTTDPVLAPDLVLATEISPKAEIMTQGASQQVLSAAHAPKSNKRRNILWLLQQRVLRMFKGWKSGREKIARI
jgi:hypothetical protein